MNHEAQEARAPAAAGAVRQQVRLRGEGGRVEARSPTRLPRYRLKRSVELFQASDGSLYLMRLGAGDDVALTAPRARDRLLLSELAEGFRTRAELEALLGVESSALDDDLEHLRQAGVLETRQGESPLTAVERERFDRQLIYLADMASDRSEALQRRLGDSTVVLVGCGGLGSWVASALSGTGIGHLVLVDDDRVELSNLNRQLLFTEAQIGTRKIDAAAASLRAHNRQLRVSGLERRIQAPTDLDDVFELGVDIVVSTADWPPHHLPRWVNEACLGHDVPWIGAGQFPPRLRVGPLVIPGRSACLECLEHATRREYPLYEEIAEWRAQGETPDSSTAFVSGVIGCLIASEVVHHLLGVFRPASVGAALLVDLQTMELEREEIAADPECRLCACATPVARFVEPEPRPAAVSALWSPV